MSVRPTRKTSTHVALLVILALLLPVSSSSSAALPSLTPTEAAPPAPSTAQSPLAELLRPDGTLDLNSGYRGSLDPAGWRLAGDGPAPRFVPATAPAASGDEFWAAGFNVPGYIDALAVDGAGNLYAGGWFTTAGGVSANCIARWDGTAWSPLGSGMDSWVYVLAVDGAGNLYAGGYFTTAGGVSANRIAKWDGTAWSPLGSGMDNAVYALAMNGAGNLYAGGVFTTAGGASANCIAQWDGTSWSPLGSGMDSGVKALAVDGAGNLYAGGVFTTAGGVSANRIAKWDGTAWSPLGSGMNNTVSALALDGTGNLYAGGWFTTAGGKPSSCIAQWTGGAPMVGIDKQGSGVVLTWTYAVANTSYEIWRYTSPYFNLVSPPATLVASGLPPTGSPLVDCTLIGKTITCSLSGGIGDPDTNFFYVVRGIQAGGPGANSNRTGEFDFALVPGN